MDAELVFAAIAIIGTFFALITDLKNKWVPDAVNYSMICIGLIGHLILSIKSGSIFPIGISFAWFILLYGLGFAALYFGLFGGGDAKLIAGIGALLATFPNQFISGPWPFMATILLNIMLFGALFGIIFLFYIFYKHWAKVSDALKKNFDQKKNIVFAILSTAAIPIVLYFFDSELYFTIILWILFFFAFILAINAKVIENITLTKKISPSKLIEGDWLTHEIKIKNELVYSPAKMGIERSDIEKLISLERNGQLPLIEIKDGLPYVTAIFAGLIASLFIGDLFVIILSVMLNG